MSKTSLKYNGKWKLIRIFLFGQVAFFKGNGIGTEKLFENAEKVNKKTHSAREAFTYLQKHGTRVFS